MSNANDFVIKTGLWGDPDAIVLQKYSGTGSHVVVPDEVTVIGWNAFAQNNSIVEVTIPASVKTIQSGAFSSCDKLEKVYFEGNGLESLADTCFEKCPVLAEVHLPDSVKSIPAKIFRECPALTRTVGNFTIAADVLLSYSSDDRETRLRIPDGVRFISGAIFGDTWSRTNRNLDDIIAIQIPEGVIHIGSNAFAKLKSLKKITFPASLRSLGSGALYFLDSITSVDLSHTAVEVLESGMFTCDHKLQEVLLPNNLKCLEDGVFNSCSSLKHIQLPASLEEFTSRESLNDGAFQNSGIVEIDIPEGIKVVPDEMFMGCEHLKTIKLPQSLEKIGKYAFMGCTSLTEIVIPDAVCEIGEDAFRHCSALCRPTLSDKMKSQENEEFWGHIGFGDENGCVVKDGVFVKYVGPIDVVTVSEGVTEIPERTLGVSGRLHKYPNEYRLPQSLKVIHEHSFGHTYDKINLPSGYLQTQDTLPAKYTYTLLIGAWSNQATIKDYAALYLFQKGKDIVKLCEVKLVNAKEAAVKCFVELLSNECKSAHVVKAAEFVVENKGSLPNEVVAQLYEIAVSKKAKKAVDLLKPIAGVEDAAPKAKKASTHPIEAFCEEQFIPHYLDKISKAARLANKDFEGVLYKDSKKKAPVFVVKCAILPYVEQMGERPKHIGSYKTDWTSTSFVENADKVAAELDQETFISVLEKIADIKNGTDKPQRLIPLCRYGNSEHIKNIISAMGKWDNWYTYATSGRSAIIVARGAIMLNESREAMMYAEKCKLLRVYAGMRNMDEDVLRDTKLADFGLDENGCKRFDLGSTVVEATVGQDLSICLYDTKAQKIVKSLPKKGADADKHAAASAELSDLKKNLKKVVKSRNDILFERFLDGKTQKAAAWIGSYTKNPVLRRVAELIVWNQKKNTFILTKNGAVDCDGNTYLISDGSPIGVAHPKDMTKAELAAWQKYFTSHGLKQPFEQIWEPVVDSKSIQTDRYKGCMIPFFRFKGREKHGISIQDWDFHNQIDISFDGCDASVERIDWRRHDIGMDDRFEITSFSIGRSLTRKVNHIVAYLDRITVYGRILNDDISVVGMLPMFTLAQIMEFINAASENNCTNVLAVLMDYKNRTFVDFDPMEEFSLDL